MLEKKFLVTDSVGKMEMLYESELNLIEGFEEFKSMTVQDYSEDIITEYEKELSLELEMLDLSKVPF